MINVNCAERLSRVSLAHARTPPPQLQSNYLLRNWFFFFSTLVMDKSARPYTLTYVCACKNNKKITGQRVVLCYYIYVYHIIYTVVTVHACSGREYGARVRIRQLCKEYSKSIRKTENNVKRIHQFQVWKISNAVDRHWQEGRGRTYTKGAISASSSLNSVIVIVN